MKRSQEFNINEDTLAIQVNFCPKTVAEIEATLAYHTDKSIQEFYLQGLREEAINTSLVDFYNILNKISNSHSQAQITICDIGSSYCKMAFIAQKFFPNIRVISIEPVKERIDYARKKLSKTNHIFINNVFNKEEIEQYEIDYYYLYFPVGEVLDSILKYIKSPIIAIEAHGQLINRLSHAYKKKSTFTKLIMPRHNPMSYLFEERHDSCEIKSLEGLIQNSNNLILINDANPWYADKDGLKVYFDDEDKITLELINPPRTIYFGQNLKTVDSCELSKDIQELIRKRLKNEKIDGCFIRKIFIDGSFELSSGEIRK